MASEIPQPPNQSNYETDLEGYVRALSEWTWAFYRSAILEGGLVTPTAAQDLVDPGIATAETAQTTANENVARLDNIQSGQVTVGFGDVVGTATFNNEFDDATYDINVTPVSDLGGPAEGSNRVKTIAKTAAGFTLTVEVDPGGADAVTFDYIAILQPS